MPDDETGKRNIFDTIPESLKATTSTEKIGDTAVEIVDPEKVARLVEKLVELGMTEINHKDGLRRLDPELARMFAQAARDILALTVNKLEDGQIKVVKGENLGSTIDGFVTPESDVDIKLDLLTRLDLEAAGKLLRTNEELRESLLLISNHNIPVVEYSLIVSRMYTANPGEQWIPQAHDIVKIKIPK